MRRIPPGLLLPLTTILLLPSTALAAPPVVTFTSAPTEMEEGDTVTLEITVTDPDGDTPTWSWDTGDDGTFDEATDATTLMLGPGDTDGDATLRIGVQATDGTEMAEAFHTIDVANVEPTITSTPGTEAGVRREYRYEIVVDDPGGANDPIDYRLTSRPPGADITDNVITWTPEPDHRGRAFPAIVRLDDGDGGEAMQMWEIMVAENSDPTAPTPAMPIERARVAAGEPVTLTVENGTDLDEDPLSYHFRLSPRSSFDSPANVESPAVEEGADGTTSWTTAEPLPTGLWYWEVWVDDGMAQSDHLYASLVVGNMGGVGADGGPGLDGAIPGIDGGDGDGDGGDGGGCAVGGSGTGSAALGWALALFALVLRRRRRPS